MGADVSDVRRGVEVLEIFSQWPVRFQKCREGQHRSLARLPVEIATGLVAGAIVGGEGAAGVYIRGGAHGAVRGGGGEEE